jgi:hypothetical protein
MKLVTREREPEQSVRSSRRLESGGRIESGEVLVGSMPWDVHSLLAVADVIAIASALEAHSSWEDGRIVTYSRLRVDRAVAGDLDSKTRLWLRTKGGTVGSVCQFVDGEAVFQREWPSLLFLVRLPMNGVQIGDSGYSDDSIQRQSTTLCEVAGGSFGQFPIVLDDNEEPRAIPSPWARVLNPLPEHGPRFDPFSTLSLERLARDLGKSWNRVHGSLNGSR